MTIALYLGAALYLAGLAAIRWRCHEGAPGRWFAAAAVPVVLMPAAHAIAPVAALGLLTAVLVGLTALTGRRGLRAAPVR